VTVAAAALKDDELRLIARLSVDAAETPERFRRQGQIMVIGSIVVAALAAVQHIWFLIAVCLVFGGLMLLLFRAAAAKNGPERYEPVLRALREAPERVRTISHAETSDSRRMFVSHWIVVTTDDGLLRVKADDWQTVLAAVAARCPGATIKA
jgi:hypothetical protein